MIGLLIGLFICLSVPRMNMYPLTTIVIDADRENDIVSCKDFSGNVWAFEGCEDYEPGDICSMIISDNGTANIKDDVIISTKYDGFIY